MAVTAGTSLLPMLVCRTALSDDLFDAESRT